MVDTLILGFSPEEGVPFGRPSRYSPEFREQAEELVRATGKTSPRSLVTCTVARRVASARTS